MAINPEILSQMKGGERIADQRAETCTLREWDTALPALTGSPAQIKWAATIRERALANVWPAATFSQLVHIVASAWWIANKSIVDTLKFKEPAPGQMEGGQSQPELPVKPARTEGQRVADCGPVPPDARANEAHLWAHSVSLNPKLAEAAILAVLAKLYKEPDIKASLKQKALSIMNAAEAATTKDAEAIFRMLR